MRMPTLSDPGLRCCRTSTDLADRAVDLHLRGGYLYAVEAPLLEDLLVGAVLDQVQQGCMDRVGQTGALGDRKPVRSRRIGRAHQLELAARLVDLIHGHGSIREAELRAARGDREVRLTLGGIRGDLDLPLAGLGALGALR